jgi:hypothetical protein
MSKVDLTKILVAAIGAITIGYVVGNAVPINPDTSDISISFAELGTVNIKAARKTVDYAAALDSLFREEFSRNAIIGWLQDRQDMYQIEDRDLVDAISEDLCDPIPDEPLQDRLQLAAACASQPVPAGLRQLADGRLPPFHYVGLEVEIGTPAQENQPPMGRANVCRERGLLGHNVRLVNPISQTTLTVEATGAYQCTGYEQVPDLQLHAVDAIKLFGRPTQRYERAIAVIVQ